MRRDQLQRYIQYFFRYYRHATVSKVINLLKIEYKLLRNESNVSGCFPHFLYVEISNKCNLFCPLCQMGQRQTVPRQNTMTLGKYIEWITPLKKYLFQVLLYDWGEPFLNRDIYDIISFNTENNIATVVSSNCNVPIDAERLVSSGCDYFILSGDGITQEVYGAYRKGGDVEKVMNVLREVVAAKKKRNARLPVVEWQCLVSRHNEHQLALLKKEVLAMGADQVRFANLNFFSTNRDSAVEDEWLPKDQRYRSFKSEKSRTRRERGIRKPCFWLWRGGVVNVNGGLTPCCLYDVPDWSNVFEDGFDKAWTGGLFREARQRSLNSSALKKNDLICDICIAPFIYR